MIPRTSTGGAGGEKTVSAAPPPSAPFIPSNGDIHTALYQRYMLQEAIKDVSAAVSRGILSNSAPCEFNLNTSTNPNAFSVSRSPSGGSRIVYVSAMDRLKKLKEGTKQIRKLLEEFGAMSEKSTTLGGSTAVAARAAASKELFMTECELEEEVVGKKVDPSEAAAAGNESPNAEKTKETLQAMRKEITSFKNVLKDLQQIRRSPGFQFEAKLQESKASKGPVTARTQFLHAILKRLEETLEDVLQLLEAAGGGTPTSPNASTKGSTTSSPMNQRGKYFDGSGASENIRSSAAPSSLGSLITIRPQVLRDINVWPVQFVQILHQVASIKPLDVLMESKREELRRITFDVEELQHEQEQAVTDGDMQKSEQLYFEQTNLLDSMKPCFDELENIINKFKSDRGEGTRQSLKLYKQNFSSQFVSAVAREEKMKSRKDGDRERLASRRSQIEKARTEQKANLTAYMLEWDKLFDQNVRQQTACFQAMEELEKRIASLAAEQAILVEDRVEKVNSERERALDAAAFFHFCDARQKEVQVAQKNVDISTQVLKDVGSAIEFGVSQLDNFLSTCVKDHAEEQMLQLQKDKLDQFRQLYITLGDLHFKKSRSADEIDKRIEYYGFQQEVAMDALNPKAKEYSQAKKKWMMVKEELENQLRALDEKSKQEAAAFEPTATLLLQNGVSFTHPVEELDRRNRVREQKLLEYKELMEEKVEEQRKREQALRDATTGGGESSSGKTRQFLPIRDDDEVILAEKMKNEEAEAAAILATSAKMRNGGLSSFSIQSGTKDAVSSHSSTRGVSAPKARLTSMDVSTGGGKGAKGERKK